MKCVIKWVIKLLPPLVCLVFGVMGFWYGCMNAPNEPTVAEIACFAVGFGWWPMCIGAATIFSQVVPLEHNKEHQE